MFNEINQNPCYGYNNWNNNLMNNNSYYRYDDYKRYNNYNRYNNYHRYPYPHCYNRPVLSPYYWNQNSDEPYVPYVNEMNNIIEYTRNRYSLDLRDYGPEPLVIDIDDAAEQNNNFRTTLWTGTHLQLTLMSIDVGDEIGLEMHPNVDQFIRIEEGDGLVRMGDSRENLHIQEKVDDDYIIIIPAGKWHNLVNTGRKPLKLYSIYAPPNHPSGTVHETKEIADEAENH